MQTSSLIKPATVAVVGALVFAAALLLDRGSLPWASAADNVKVKVTHREPRSAVAATTAKGMPSDAEEAARRYQVPVTTTQPIRGPSDAPVTIVHWCDFRSRPCRVADVAMTRIMKEYDGRVRWVFRHLPTSPEDVGVHLMSHAVFHQLGRFWEVRAALLEQPEGKVLGHAELAAAAGGMGLDWNTLEPSLQSFGGFVGADIRFADQFGIDRPLGFFVNGRRLPRSTPDLYKGLKRMVDEELVVAKRLGDEGVAPGEVYQKLIGDGYWGVKDDPEARKAALAKKAAEEAAAAPAQHGQEEQAARAAEQK